ncbi:MAG TPA: flagellar hook-associated protein 3 [Bdellovibrionales bacterium]|nr:MAG: flagellar hook-associated protein 3 [Bdellovibrionales bacterium GWB1_52_6]OFZ04381.1 MAG: flagellar hook-associated protein 3 [Bdellovibrionales bacterium GWA1_52_35]OFZ38578.1 MAG: flagellar hook-associated protein 3 [Bdellovibrionales bacterium GWC1_52_8]HAR44567.1 flagellar hook-associated protein 3 [Bdellovibrionales bacterium]HCM40763.1 flagellar hook-associated protein 3 [Bdellovibrionales bacterium]
MRVTERTNFDTVRDSIQRSKQRMENLQMQSSTLKKINTPSDDPVSSAKVLEMRTEKVNNDQFQGNAKMAQMVLQNTDHALSELSDIVVRAKEIALGQSSKASSNENTRLGVAEEVTQLFQQAVATANRRIGEKYIFAGFKTDKPAVDPEGRYMGDDGQQMVEIAKDVFISSNLPGIEAFNTNPKSSSDAPGVYNSSGRTLASSTGLGMTLDQSGRDNVNVFDEIQNLRISLLTGDLDGIRNTLDRFDQAQGKLIAARAKVGSRLQGVESTSQAIERHNLTNAQLSSALEDADMSQVVSDLAKEETVYKSALASSQKLIQPTLLDFLK